MPSNIAPAQPVDVFPRIISASTFTEELRLEEITNSYPDGSSDRQALATTPRRYFHFTFAVTTLLWQRLWTFYLVHKAQAFYIYNPRETVPPFSYDPTGQDPIGRYTMVFDSAWSETTAMTRGQVAFSLREVA